MSVKRRGKEQSYVCAGLFFLWPDYFLQWHPFAQDLTVKGKVTDTTGETVIGANVTVKGTTNGIITDIDGNYTLSGVKPSSVLVFSFIGYKTQEIPCSGRQEIKAGCRRSFTCNIYLFSSLICFISLVVLNQMHLFNPSPEVAAQSTIRQMRQLPLPDGCRYDCIANTTASFARASREVSGALTPDREEAK